ncbi:MAG: RluA family pseudouridine synthase [Salinivirgaceae bacterium]|nr:RluA family pseudouridine synthase [Salinivirgaceae bacterium]
MEVLSSYIVPQGSESKRLGDFTHIVLDTISTKSAAKKAIKKGEILVDGVVVEPSRFVRQGQVIEHIEISFELKRIFELPLKIVFEDEHLAVIFKPAGYSVSGNYFRTIENAIPFNFKKSNTFDALNIPKPVHRLDNQTSGLLIIAKTNSALLEFGRQFEKKLIKKKYQAVVIGEPEMLGSINLPIDGKEAVTTFEVVKTVHSIKYNTLSLVNLFPQTGRTHQLRIHLAKIGHPILGDKLYTPEELLFKGKGLFLSAVDLQFEHPILKKQTKLEIPTPNKFNALLNREEARWEKYQALK